MRHLEFDGRYAEDILRGKSGRLLDLAGSQTSRRATQCSSTLVAMPLGRQS